MNNKNCVGLIFSLLLLLTFCHPPDEPIPTDLGDGFSSIQPRSGAAGTSLQLKLSESINNPADVKLLMNNNEIRSFVIMDPWSINLNVADSDPGILSIEVIENSRKIAQVAKGFKLLEASKKEDSDANPKITKADADYEKDPGPGSNWWMLHQDLEHSSNMRTQNSMTPLQEQWKQTFQNVLHYSQIVKGEGKLLTSLSTNGNELVAALDPVTGNIVWTFLKTMTPAMVSGLVAIHGNVYFVEGSGLGAKLHAVDVSSGASVWTTNLPTWSQSGLASAFGKVYVLLRNGSLRCYNAMSGALEWQQNVNVDGGTTLSSPAIGFGNVYVGTSEGLRVFDANSGNAKWSANGPGNGNASPVIVMDVGVGNPALVVIGSVDNVLRAYHVTNGSLLWEYSGNMDLWYTTPATSNKKLYLQQDRTIVELDVVTGAQTSASPDLGGETATAPTINYNELFVITRNDKLHVLSLTDLSIVQTLDINASPGGEQGQQSTESLWLYFQANWSDPYPAVTNTIYGYKKQN